MDLILQHPIQVLSTLTQVEMLTSQTTTEWRSKITVKLIKLIVERHRLIHRVIVLILGLKMIILQISHRKYDTIVTKSLINVL